MINLLVSPPVNTTSDSTAFDPTALIAFGIIVIIGLILFFYLFFTGRSKKKGNDKNNEENEGNPQKNNTQFELTEEEKKLVEAFRKIGKDKGDSDQKK